MSRQTTAERRWRILKTVLRDVAVPFRDLLSELRSREPGLAARAVSSDLRALADLNLVVQIRHGHWGVPSVQPGLYRDRLGEKKEEKAAIAKYVESLIIDGASLGLDSGTSVTALFFEIAASGKTHKIFTSNIHGVFHLMNTPNCCTVEIMNGTLDSEYMVAVGDPATLRKPYLFDVAVVGVSYVADDGIATLDKKQHGFKHWLCMNSREVLIPVSNEKLCRPRGSNFVDFKDLKSYWIVTDSNVASIRGAAKRSLEAKIAQFGNHVVMVDAKGNRATKLSNW